MILVEKVGCHDLVVVVRRMSECAFAVAVAQRIDTLHASAKLIVNLNVSALVGLDSGSL
jgi:hypothetical protein